MLTFCTESNAGSSNVVGVHCQFPLVQEFSFDPFLEQDGSVQGQDSTQSNHQLRLLRFPRRYNQRSTNKQILHGQVCSSESKPGPRSLFTFHKCHRHRSSESHHVFSSRHDHPTQSPETDSLNNRSASSNVTKISTN